MMKDEKSPAAVIWEMARAELAGLPGGRGLNIAHEAVSRHARGERCEHIAMRFLRKAGSGGEIPTEDLTYARLDELTNRFANVLRGLGVGRGERVFSLAGRVPELYATALGTLASGAVFCPLFSSFGPEPIRTRLELGGARVLVTTPRLYRRKVAKIRHALPKLEHVLLIDDGESASPETTASLTDLLASASPEFEIPPTDPQDPALLHFTSGTTGRPKGALHVHEAVVLHHLSGRLALDLRPEDVYWCTADPGWVTGTSYGIVAPLTRGVTMIVDEEEFDAGRWYRILEEERVNVWYTAPTAIRMLMRLGDEPRRGRSFPALRHLASVGEPLNPEAVRWGAEVFGRPIHDTWWQTETGAIMIANLPGMEIVPGSMGRPLPGIEAVILRRRQEGSVEIIDEPGTPGELALRRGWPSMFRSYLGEEERYARSFTGDWYLSGDLAERDANGYFWFVGRADDAIQSAGHLIGPFEVESALMEHEAVAEVGVIGKPDPVTFETVKAFVSLKSGFRASPELELELMAHARQRLGPAVAPREIDFRQDLPKTRSGKILRRLLKAEELELPSEDQSRDERVE